MKDLGIAIAIKHPGAVNGVDYLLIDHLDGNGPQIEFWDLPGNPPQSQSEVDAILSSHEDKIVEREAERDPEWPSLEERVSALESAVGTSQEVRNRMESIKQSKRQNFTDRMRGRGSEQ